MRGHMPSVMNHNFSNIPEVSVPRSTFNRSHGNKTTFDSGYLVPIFVDEALPGDTFNLHMTAFARLATPLHPFMDNLHLETFFFAVPNRLLWDNWERFNGEQDNPGDSTDYLIPQINNTNPAIGTLQDYFGLPVDATYDTSALPFRAYNLIYNEWFRDENLQDSLPVNTGDGPDPDDGSLYNLVKRGKRHDYFTSCLPWPQKGEAVTLPLGERSPLTYDNVGAGGGLAIQDATDTPVFLNVNGTRVEPGSPAGSDYRNMFVDLSNATAATINDLREAFQIQKLYEKDARGGTRYVEVIRSHFGVVSPDARMQRPEYLGGGYSPIQVNPVAQTSASTNDSPQGNLSAIGTAAFKGHGFVKSFTEHCTIIGLMNVRADLTYQQGINRMWSRKNRFDFYWPSLAHLGEQAVLSKEIFTDGTADDELVFGYQERYAEYRYKPSLITGKFRSNQTDSLDTWHLSQDFETRPVLDPTFIEENPPIDRVVAVTSQPQFLMDSYFNYKCTRPLPTYGVPGLIDHF